MSASLILACLWVIASALVALLPMRAQYPPGIFLLISAPILICYLTYQHGLLALGVSLAAFISMFRNPLVYLWRKFSPFRREGDPVPGPSRDEEKDQS